MKLQPTFSTPKLALAFAAILPMALLTAGTSFAANSYTVTNLVSDQAGKALNTDPNLVNAWGLIASSSSPWWVSDNGTGKSTLYDGSGNILPLVVTIPPAPGGATGSPTGTVATGGLGFTGSPAFAFVSADGVITSWASGSVATVVVDNSASGASYTGATLNKIGTKNFLYAANLSAGTIEVYNTSFKLVNLGANAFKDTMIPAGYGPYNIQSVGAVIAVTYAKQNFGQGAGMGYVDVYNADGMLLQRLQHGAWMNAPWGVAKAPSNFGFFSGALLVGQLGSGWVAAFAPKTGKFVGYLKDSAGSLIFIDGLWGLSFGNGTGSGPTNSLYFTAGPSFYSHGLFGTITAN